MKNHGLIILLISMLIRNPINPMYSMNSVKEEISNKIINYFKTNNGKKLLRLTNLTTTDNVVLLTYLKNQITFELSTSLVRLIRFLDFYEEILFITKYEECVNTKILKAIEKQIPQIAQRIKYFISIPKRQQYPSYEALLFHCYQKTALLAQNVIIQIINDIVKQTPAESITSMVEVSGVEPLASRVQSGLSTN